MESTEAVSLEESPLPDESKEIRIALAPVSSPLRKPGNGSLQDVAPDTGSDEPKISSGTASQTTLKPRLPISSRTLWYPLTASPPDIYGTATTPPSKETLFPHFQNYSPRVVPNSHEATESSRNPQATSLLKSPASNSQNDGEASQSDDSFIVKPLPKTKPKGDITKPFSNGKEAVSMRHTQLAPFQHSQNSYRMPRRDHVFEEAQQRLNSKIRVAELRLQHEQGNASLRLQQQNQKRENILAAAQIQALRLQQQQQRQQEILTAAEISSLNRRDNRPVVQREIQILKVPTWRHEDVAHSPPRYDENYNQTHRTSAITPKHTPSEFSEHFSETHPILTRTSTHKDAAPSQSRVLELQGQESRGKVSHTETPFHPLTSKNDQFWNSMLNEKRVISIDRRRTEAFPKNTEKLRSTYLSNQFFHPVTRDVGNEKRSEDVPPEMAKQRTLNSSPQHSMIYFNPNEKSVHASHPRVPLSNNRSITHEPALFVRHMRALSSMDLPVTRQELHRSFPLRSERSSQAFPQHVRPNIHPTEAPRSDAHSLRLLPQAHSEEALEPLAIHQKLFEQSKEHHPSGSERPTLLHKRDDALEIFRIDDEGGIRKTPTSGTRRSDASTNAKRSQSTNPIVVRVDEDGGLHYPQNHRSRPLSHQERPLQVQQKQNSLHHVLVQAPTPSRPKTAPLYPRRESSEKTHRSLTPRKEVDYVDEDGGIHRSVLRHPRHVNSMQNLSRRDGILVAHHTIRRHHDPHIFIHPMERAKHPHGISINKHDTHTNHFHLAHRPPHLSVLKS